MKFGKTLLNETTLPTDFYEKLLRYDVYKRFLKHPSLVSSSSANYSALLNDIFRNLLKEDLKSSSKLIEIYEKVLIPVVEELESVCKKCVESNLSISNAHVSKLDFITSLLDDLNLYVDLQQTGFRKILKKHAKVTGTTLLEEKFSKEFLKTSTLMNNDIRKLCEKARESRLSISFLINNKKLSSASRAIQLAVTLSDVELLGETLKRTQNELKVADFKQAFRIAVENGAAGCIELLCKAAPKGSVESLLADALLTAPVADRGVVEAFLAVGALPSTCDWRGRTPLAALADVSVSTDKEGARDASTSIESNIVDAALALLEAGASLTTPDMLGRTALHIAALRGNVKLIDTFIAKAGAKLATDLLITKDANGFTPLHSAVIYHRVSAVTHLLSAIKLLSNDQSVDAKKRAQLSKLVECASADDDSNNTDNDTTLSAPPVLLCAAMTRPAEPRAFVQRVNEATIYRSARLITDKHAAAMVKCASLLIEAGANVEARNVEGATLLHCAIQTGSIEVVKLLLKLPQLLAVLESVDMIERTPLHTAAGVDDRAMCKALTAAGANAAARDVFGETPSDILNASASSGTTSVLIALSGKHVQRAQADLLQSLAARATLRSIRTVLVHGTLTVLLVVDTSDLEPIKQVVFVARSLQLDAQYKLLPAQSVVSEKRVANPTHDPVFAAALADHPNEPVSPASSAPDPIERVDPLEDAAKLVLTVLCVTSHVPTPLYAIIAQTLAKAGCSIQRLQRLSDDNDSHIVVEYLVTSTFSRTSPQFNELSQQLRTAASQFKADVALQQQSLLRGRKRMVVFDIAGTLLSSDALGLLAEANNKTKELQQIQEKYKENEEEMTKETAKLLKGLTWDQVNAVRSKLVLARGARELCRTLKRLGYRLAAISGQTNLVVDWVKQELGLDFVYSNSIEMIDGVATGNLTGLIVTSQSKIDFFHMLCQREKINELDCIAIGKEGAGFSQSVLDEAGLGVILSHSHGDTTALAFNKNITSVLYLLGFSRSQLLADASTAPPVSSEDEDKSENESFESADCEQSIVTVVGSNRVGVMSTMMNAIVNVEGAVVLDIQESGTVDRLLVVMLLSEPKAAKHAALKELLFEINTMSELSIRYDSIVGSPLRFLKLRGEHSHAVTVLGATLSFQFLAQLSELLEQGNGALIHEVRMLSGPNDPWQCLEFIVDVGDSTIAELKLQLLNLGLHFGADVALQPEQLLRREKRMVVFDMDSTLIQAECIDEMAEYAGVGDQVKAVTRRAMNGELDFSQSLRTRVALLKDQPVDIFAHVLRNLNYTPGAHLLCRALKQMGYKLALLSGGFLNIASEVKRELGLDYAFANTLEVRKGKLTGRVLGGIVDARKKADLLNVIASQEGIATEQVIAIGDGANDLPMLFEAGLGVAFNAKPNVQKKASFRINQHSLIALVYFLGISTSQLEACVREMEN